MKELPKDFLNVENYFAEYTLKQCLLAEVQKGEKPFSWVRTIHRAIKCQDRRFYFWFRIWCYLYQTDKFGLKKIAKKRMAILNFKYSSDIHPAAKIDAGLSLRHLTGVIIRADCIIRKNAVIRQGVTIGMRKSTDTGYVKIGDNVEIGANTCIIGDIRIGDNVTIGALTLVNKDIPNNHIVYSQNTLVFKNKDSRQVI